MADDFPLTVEQLIDVLAALAPASSRIRSLKRFVEQKLPPGYPVKLGKGLSPQCNIIFYFFPSDIPLFPTISARITFQKFGKMEMNDDLFKVPTGYHEVSDESTDA